MLTILHFSTDRANSSEEGVVEGILTRKHEWESTTKKASNRSWDKVIILKQPLFHFPYCTNHCVRFPGLLLCEIGSLHILQGPEDGKNYPRTDMAW